MSTTVEHDLVRLAEELGAVLPAEGDEAERQRRVTPRAGERPSSLYDRPRPVPVERVGAKYTSNTALENASVELLVHADAAAASVAFSAAQRGSACPGEENFDEEGRVPHPLDIAGPDEAFSMGYVNPNGANGRRWRASGRRL